MAAADPQLEAALGALGARAPYDALRLLRGQKGAALRGDPEAWLVVARAYVAEARNAEAGIIIERLLDAGVLPRASQAVALGLKAHVAVTSGDPALVRHLVREALELGGPTGEAANLAHMSRARLAMFAGDLRGAARAARRAGEAATTDGQRDRAAALEAMLLMQLDRFVEAERLASRPVGGVTPHRRLELGAIRFHSGRWDSIELVLDPRRPADSGQAFSDESWATMAGLLTVVHVHADRLAEARELVAEGTHALATGPRPLFLWGALLLAEAGGDAAATMSMVDRLVSALDLTRSPGRLRMIGPDLVRVLCDAGEQARAGELAATLERVAAGSGVPSMVAAGMLCRGLFDGDVAALREAAVVLERAGRPLEQAMALDALSRLLTERGARAEAVAVTRAALAVYAGLGAVRDERRLGARLRSLGSGIGRRGPRARERVGWLALSPTESNVARLVATGLTNAEIGREMAISARTVESHVAHIMAKLSVRRRAEIAAAAAVSAAAAAVAAQAGS